MRVVITGSGGNLGTKLRRHLDGGYEIIAISRSDHGDPGIHAADMTVWNDAWLGLLKRADVVVHLAANPSPDAAWADLVAPNIDMVLNIYSACVATSIKRVVFASSNHVMGGYRYRAPVKLQSATPPLPDSPYGASKLMGERIGRSFGERHGISSINVRIGRNRHGDNARPAAATDAWVRKMWLSDRDYCRLMECCINAPASLRWAVINGVSGNTGMQWDLSEAADLVGYVPQDNAFG